MLTAENGKYRERAWVLDNTTELLNKPGDAYVSLYFTQFLIVIAIFHQCFCYLHMKAFLTHTSC